MANHSVLPSPESDETRGNDASRVPALNPSGPRKLIRPSLPARVLNSRGPNRRDSSPLLAHHEMAGHSPVAHSSHAEAFYFQKQMQAQTSMVFVLEDGERVEGCIEWFDTHAIKVRHGSARILIYKTAIKYLHKAGENARI